MSSMASPVQHDTVLASETTEAGFLVVFTDVWLIVPPDRGSEMLGCSNGTLPEMGKMEVHRVTIVCHD